MTVAAHHPRTLSYRPPGGGGSDTGCADKGPVEGQRTRAPLEEGYLGALYALASKKTRLVPRVYLLLRPAFPLFFSTSPGLIPFPWIVSDFFPSFFRPSPLLTCSTPPRLRFRSRPLRHLD